MGCYLLHEDQVFIIPDPRTDESVFLSVENAIVENNEDFFVFKPISPDQPLDFDKHRFIYEGKWIHFYCQFCINRIRSIQKGCHHCLFHPVHTFVLPPMNIPSLIESLKNLGYYQVDRAIFQDQLFLKKQQKKRKKRWKRKKEKKFSWWNNQRNE